MLVRRRAWLNPIAVGLLLAACGGVYADEAYPPVKVRSEGRVIGTTLDARDEAVRDAKRQAVALWLESMLGQPPEDRLQPMLDHAQDYVQSSRVVTLDTQDGHTHVDLEVYLYERALRADLASVLFQQRSQPPQLVLLVIEEDETSGARRFQSQSRVAPALAEAFRSRGFALLDPDRVLQRYSERDLLGLSSAGASALGRCAREFHTDALVLIDAKLSVTANQAGVGALRAHVVLNASVVGASDGRLYERTRGEAEVNCQAPEDGFRFAVDDALYKIRDRLIVGSVLAGWRPAPSDLFELTLENAPSWDAVERVGDRVRAYPGAAKVEVLTGQHDSGTIRFEYGGSIGELVRSLQQPLRDGYVLQPEVVVNRTMRFRFVKQ